MNGPDFSTVEYQDREIAGVISKGETKPIDSSLKAEGDKQDKRRGEEEEGQGE